MGLHSALAIKRQRKRRDEQRRARERRYSQQSNESGLGESNSSFVSPRSSVRGRRRHQSSNAPDALVDNKVSLIRDVVVVASRAAGGRGRRRTRHL